MKINSNVYDRLLLTFIYISVCLVVVVTLYPFWRIFILSISPREEAIANSLHIFTRNPTLDAYVNVLTTSEIWRGFLNTFIRVGLGTTLSVGLTAMTAYPLSKQDYPYNKCITSVILFTMIFNGGLIPTYLLIKSLGLMDSVLALILPTSVTAYNLIIMKNFLKTIPITLEESAKLDGASDWLIWRKIIIPLSKPVLATIALWQAVAHWNAYFDALIYISDPSKFVLQVILRRILLENEIDMYISSTMGANSATTTEVVKAATIIVSTLPIILIYPFLQKYFVKGIMLGSVKG